MSERPRYPFPPVMSNVFIELIHWNVEETRGPYFSCSLGMRYIKIIFEVGKSREFYKGLKVN